MRFAVSMKNRLDLSETEMKYLLGEKDEHKVKDILEVSERADETQAEIEVTTAEEIEEKRETESKQEVKQPSLFDF